MSLCDNKNTFSKPGWCPCSTKSSRSSASQWSTVSSGFPTSSTVCIRNKFSLAIVVGFRGRWHEHDVLRVQLGEEHLQQDVRDQCHLHSSNTSSHWQGKCQSTVPPFGHIMPFSGFSGSGGFWRGPWENHCNGDELLSKQVLQSHPGHNLVEFLEI